MDSTSASAPVRGHDDVGRTSRMGGKAPSVAARKSLDHLRNQSQDLEHLNKGMFQDEGDDYGDEDEMDGPELNLTSWGVNRFLSKDGKKKRRRHSRGFHFERAGRWAAQRGTHAPGAGSFASCACKRPCRSGSPPEGECPESTECGQLVRGWID
jgi:hypothetical protein